jgi:hypothetical protein
MYIQRLAENLVQKAFFVFEIFSFEVDAYVYAQKLFLLSRRLNLTPFFLLRSKEGGLYYMGGTYIFFLHPKWSKLCTVPLMGPKNPPTKKKFKKNIFDLLFGPFKKVIFCSFYAFPGGT